MPNLKHNISNLTETPGGLWIRGSFRHVTQSNLTCVSQFAVPEHGYDDQQVTQHIHHRGEDQHAGQDGDDPGGAGGPLRGQAALQLPKPWLCPVL